MYNFEMRFQGELRTHFDSTYLTVVSKSLVDINRVILNVIIELLGGHHLECVCICICVQSRNLTKTDLRLTNTR